MLKQFTIMIDVVMDTVMGSIKKQKNPHLSDIPVDVLCFRSDLVDAIRHSQPASIVNGFRVVENAPLIEDKDAGVSGIVFEYGHTGEDGTEFYRTSKKK